MRAVGSQDGFFVAFAKDKDEIAGLSEINGAFNGGFAVKLNDDLVIFHAGFFAAYFEHLSDFGWAFVTRVILGEDADVAVFACDFATLFAGGFVALAGAAKEGNDVASFTWSFDGSENLFKSVGRVGKINDDFKLLAEIKAVHAALNFF